MTLASLPVTFTICSSFYQDLPPTPLPSAYPPPPPQPWCCLAYKAALAQGMKNTSGCGSNPTKQQQCLWPQPWPGCWGSCNSCSSLWSRTEAEPEPMQLYCHCAASPVPLLQSHFCMAPDHCTDLPSAPLLHPLPHCRSLCKPCWLRQGKWWLHLWPWDCI